MKLHEITNVKEDARTHMYSHLLPMGRIGLEVELEGFDDGCDFNSSLWHVTEDHSLRNYGREFIFSSPSTGEDTLVAIKQLCDYLSSYSRTIVATPRAAIHVHLDVRGMTTEELWRLHIIYLILEPYLFEVFGQGRLTNQYCIPFSQVHWDVERLKNFRSTSPSSVMHGISNCAKYLSINSLPVRTQGSVEFRLFSTSTDYDTIVDICRNVLFMGVIAKDESINLTQRSDDFIDMLGIGEDYHHLIKQGIRDADYFGHMDEMLESSNKYGNMRQPSVAKGATLLEEFAKSKGMPFDANKKLEWENDDEA